MLVHTIGFFCMFGVVSLIILIFFMSSPGSGDGGANGEDSNGPPVEGPEDEGPEGPIHGPDSDPEKIVRTQDDEDCISREFLGDDENDDDLLEPAF